MPEFTLGIIGGGNMGQALARGALAARLMPPERLVIAEIHPEKRELLAPLRCTVVESASDAMDAEHVILAVKPFQFPLVAKAVAPLRNACVVISIMAGLSTDRIRRDLGPLARLVRAMPNTPCQIGQGMTAIAPGAGARPGDERFAARIFESIGRTVFVEEAHLDAVTAVSGSGPAYVFLLAEAMHEAARQSGLDEATARLLVVQTLVGAADLLRDSGADPADLRRAVTTPQGTTAAAIAVLERRGFTAAMIEAVLAAQERGRQMEAEGGTRFPEA